MKSKVIGWNINQRSGMGKGIPQFVIDELIDQNADIIVLTELFQHSTIGYFWAEMERAGYQHAVTQNNGTNEVGILWKKDVYTFLAVDDSVVTTMKNNHPNFLLVDLEDQNGQFLTVAGFRIRMVDYSQYCEMMEEIKDIRRRKEKLEKENKAKEKKHPVLMIADCNNLRRETTETSWNLQVVDHILSQGGFERHTPCGQSIFEEHADRGYAYEFAEDHLITRDIVVELGDYDREFVRRDRIAYPWGKDFQTHDKEHRRRVSVEPGFPDHAIVKGYLSTEKDQKK